LIPHEEYSQVTVEKGNDIALIKLSRSIDFASDHQTVQCACLPANSGTVMKSRCFVVGWGKTNPKNQLTSFRLHEVEVPILENDYCSKYSFKNSFDPERQLCAGYKQGGKDACQVRE